MSFGARLRPPGSLGWLARTVPPQLDAFVLPSEAFARAVGLDIGAAGLRAVATPRHATILLIVGALPPTLREAAAVVYAQMPRPRLIVALEAGDLAPLPEAEITAVTDQAGLAAALAKAREWLRGGAWSQGVAPFEAEVLVPKRRERKGPPQEQAQHANKKPVEGGGEAGDHAGHAGAQPSGAGNATAKAGGASGGMDHSSMGHGGMEMGFMSMVRLTKNLPRSSDGLPMERVQAPFGPLFQGLPAGLGLTLWLDGDSVAKVQLAAGAASGRLELTGDTATFPERLARLDPLAPGAYRLLAERALGRRAALGDVAALELERAASHLSWLSSFGQLLGNAWLSQRAAAWELRLRRESAFAALSLESDLLGFLARVRRTPLLSRRLRGIGRLEIDELAGVGGPVARASGLKRDARLGDPIYAPFSFAPVTRAGGDALARLEVRLEEIRDSLALARAALRAARVSQQVGQRPSGAGEADIETPRGAARLKLITDGGRVTDAELKRPSQPLVPLIERMTQGLELADALVAVHSLDPSPWELTW